MFAIMDSNENENYCYQQQQQPQKQGAAAAGAVPKVVADKSQNQFNNNNNVAEQENLMPQVNGARTGRECESERSVVVSEAENLEIPETNSTSTPEQPTAEQSDCCRHNGKAESSTNQTEPHPEEANEEEEEAAAAAAAAAQAELDSDDGDCSDNNSLGNLSYISENGLIEEIILLPNNIYSDDENGSDDCVYAYRGDLQAPALLEFRDQPADDETDFLEMDFDPEPSSELENLLEHQEISIDPFQHARGIERSPEVRSPSEAEPLLDCGVAVAAAAPAEITKNMGAIPKRLPSFLQPMDDEQPGPSRATVRSNARHLKLDLKLCTDDGGQMSGYYTYNYPYYNPRDFARDEDEDNSCLDCTEKQFLMQTKQDLSVQKVCHRCHSRNASHGGGGGGGDYFHDQGPSLNSSNSETDLMSIRAEQIVLQALNKINELKATPPSLGLSRSAENVGCVESTELVAATRDQEVPADFAPEIFSENTVTIYTLNCGELTIIEALTRIGVAPNLDVIRQYFTEQYAVDTSKMNIPQYLLYMSKRDCNFRKLIEAIKSCSEETLDVQYYPLDPFSDTPEVVQINSAEIAKRWNANTNLRQIISFKHKHFHKLNVLGKIVNILRQPSKGRNTNQTINIPQYYKSGSITITRIV